MNISLVFPPFYLASLYNLPPVGLLNLAAQCTGVGQRVTMHDFVLDLRLGTIASGPDLYDRCAAAILSASPAVVAFSGQCTTYPAVIRIAREVKQKRPDVRVVIGGHNACFVDRESLTAFPWVDVIVRGEGEVTFRALVDAWQRGASLARVPGITWRSGTQVIRNPDRPLVDDLDQLPMPRYDLVPPLSVYRDACGLDRSIAILEVGRGCPHRCVYCSESAFWQRKTRTFSPRRLVKDMRTLVRDHGAQCFLLAYDQFTAERRFVEDFCNLIIDAGLAEFPWYCISRLDTVDADLLALMKAAGCESMCYGIDSGSKKTLAFIRKRIDEDILYRRVRETTDQGMVPTLSFVIGFPEEQKADVDATLILALKTGIQGNSNPLMQLPTVLPGTELHRRYATGLVRVVDSYFAQGMEFDKGRRFREDDRLIDAYPKIFSSFYNLPTEAMALERVHRLAETFPLLVNLFPKTTLLLILALELSASDLFFDWLSWLKGEDKDAAAGISAADCFRSFPLFARRRCGELSAEHWSHLPEMIIYETRAIEAGKFSMSPPLATADTTDARSWRPVRSKSVVLERFQYPLPGILSDMKAGLFREHYPNAPVSLVFFHENGTLEVMEINAFGGDLLSLADGCRPVADIAEMLYPVYGSGMDKDAFNAACLSAAVDLGALRILVGSPPD